MLPRFLPKTSPAKTLCPHGRLVERDRTYRPITDKAFDPPKCCRISTSWSQLTMPTVCARRVAFDGPLSMVRE